jgi:hypothetical protein
VRTLTEYHCGSQIGRELRRSVFSLRALGSQCAPCRQALGCNRQDAATRAALIDLMARVLVVVFHEEGGSVNDRGQDVEFLSLARARGSACRRGYGVLRTGKAAPQIETTETGERIGRA